MEENKSDLIRSFIAIEFPDSVVKEVARVQEVLENQKFQGKLTELENLHLTLKFLGENEPDKIVRVKDVLRKIEFRGFEARLGNVGIFHFRGNPRIVWIKLLGKEIYELQEKIDRALSEAGLFSKEERFMGHLAIARIKYVKDKKGFDEHVKNISVRDIKLKVDSFALKKSDLMPLGPVYTNLEEYKLILEAGNIV